MERETKIVLYRDIITNYQDINAWTSEESFPVNKLKASERDQFTKFNVIEIVFPGFNGNKKSNNVFEEFELFFKQYVLNNSCSAYLVKVGHSCALKSKVRSYKGIIPRQLNRNDYIEIEVDVENNCSVILGIAKIIESNIGQLISSIYDSTNCFVLLANSTAVFSKNFLEDLFCYSITVDRTVYINYLKLIQSICIGYNTLLRVGGDGGDVEMSLQVFALASETNKVMEHVNKLISIKG